MATIAFASSIVAVCVASVVYKRPEPPHGIVYERDKTNETTEPFAVVHQ